MWKVYIFIAVVAVIFAYIGYRFDKSSVQNNMLKQKINNYGNFINSFITFFSLTLFVGCSLFVVIYAMEDSESGKILEEVSKSVEVQKLEVDEDNEISILSDNDVKDEKFINYDFNRFNELNNEVLTIDFKSLLIENKDSIGWLKINNSNVNYPVVQTYDNSYYLSHTFTGEKASHGWIFMDYRNNENMTDKNTIIYGHMTNTDKIMGSLKNIIKNEWYLEEKNQIITYASFDKNLYYKIFSIYEIPVENYYITTDFTNNDFGEFVEVLKGRSVYDFDTSVTSDDYILTISTCSMKKGNRIVIHAKLIYTN